MEHKDKLSHIAIPKELSLRLNQICKQKGYKKGFIVTQLIEEAIKGKKFA